jgi:Tfp pilus assembly protein PilX
MTMSKRIGYATAQFGVALPVMLIMLAVMLIGSLYLIRSSTSSTLAATNLAYDSSLSRAADGGLMKGFAWLQQQANSNKPFLNSDGDNTNGYNAHFDTSLKVGSNAFWNNQSTTYTDSNLNTITYTIYRMCFGPGIPVEPNHCMATAANTSTNNNTVAVGASLSVDSAQLNGSRQIHYIITAKITGPRGGNVVNQMVVMIGA